MIRRILNRFGLFRRPPATPTKDDPVLPIPGQKQFMDDYVRCPRGEAGSATLIFWGSSNFLSHQQVDPELVDGADWEEIREETTRALKYAQDRAKIKAMERLTDDELTILIDNLYDGDHYTGLYTAHPELVQKLRAAQRSTR